MKFFIPIILFAIAFEAYSQCCSVGIPSGGTTNLGILSENTIRTNVFYRFSNSNDYFSGSTRLNEGLVKNGKFSFIGYNIGYGLTNELLIEAEGGYFLTKSQEYAPQGISTLLSANGFSNHLISLKYNVIDKFESGFELSVGGGVKFPFTTEPFAAENVILPYDLQPSTGAIGYALHLFANLDISDDARLFLIHRSELNTFNNQDYKYGEVFITSVFLSHQLYESFTGILQLRNETKMRDKLNEKVMTNSGAILFFLSPQINYSLENLNFTFIFDYPFYKYYNGKQLANNYSAALNVSYLLDLN
jgi:hypothetical protein